MRSRFLLLSSLALVLVLMLLGCSLGRIGTSRITATPTKTQRPLFTATHTPSPTTPPTHTPLPTNTLAPTEVPATDTPIPTDPPPPTETALAPTEPPPTDLPSPTDTPIPPTETAAPATEPPPPPASDTPAPPTVAPNPQVDFRVMEIVAFEDGSLSRSGFHNVYLTVLDAGGTPLDGIILEESNNQPPVQVTTGDKGPGKTEYTMYAGDYKFKIVGDTGGQAFSSEETHVLSIAFGHAVWDDLIRGGICSDPAACEALGPIHFSYNVTFQRAW
jgi:outer membrane biosynthesis protein TonB